MLVYKVHGLAYGLLWVRVGGLDYVQIACYQHGRGQTGLH